MGLWSVNMGRPMASINDTARNSGGMMRSTKLESELTDSGRAMSFARSR